MLAKQGWKQFLLSLKLQAVQLPTVVERICNAVAEISGKVNLVEGMTAALDTLRSRCHILGIVTSNSEQNVRRILDERHVKYFDIVQAGGLSNKGELLAGIMRSRSLAPNSTYYIGDEVRDVEAAKSACMQSVAVTWGVSDEEVLRFAKPDFLIAHPSDIENVVTNRCISGGL